MEPCFGEWTDTDKCKQCPKEKECLEVTQVMEEEEEEHEPT